MTSFKKNINVPKYIFPSQLMSKWTADLPILIIGWYYTKEALGYYIFAVSMMSIPKKLIADSFQAVFLQKANDLFRNDTDSLSSLMKLVYPVLIVVITVPVTMIALLAPGLFGFIFGEQWVESGRIIQLITLQYILSVVLEPFASLRRILRQERKIFIINLLSLFFKIFPLAILITNPTLEHFLLWYSSILAAYLFLNLSDLIISTTKRSDSVKIITFCFITLLMSFCSILYLS